MITVAFVHVGPDALLARIMVASARRAIPGARIVHLADEATPSVDGVDETLRRPYDGAHLMSFRLEHFAGLAPCNAVFFDTDIMVEKDFTPLFDWEFDVALTVREDMVIDPFGVDVTVDMPYNTGVMLAKPSGWRFWHDAALRCAALPDDQRRWWGDQHAVKAAADTAPLCVLDLPCSLYNHSPHVATDDIAGRFAIHYKGYRKPWMIERGLREFGLK